MVDRRRPANLPHSDSSLSVSGSASLWALLYLIVGLGVHLGIYLADDLNGGRVVNQEQADLLQAVLFCHVLALAECFQEVRLQGLAYSAAWKIFLHNPAMVLLERHLIGLGGHRHR